MSALISKKAVLVTSIIWSTRALSCYSLQFGLIAALAQISFITEIMCANLSAKGQRQRLLCPIATAEPQDHGPGTPDHGPYGSHKLLENLSLHSRRSVTYIKQKLNVRKLYISTGFVWTRLY